VAARGLLIFVASVTAAVAATAAADPIGHPADPVPDHPGLTYLDLIRLADPVAPSRRLADPDTDRRWLPHLAPDTIGDVRPLVAGRPRIALLVGPGAAAHGATLLMLFDDAPRPKLLDVAEVGLPMPTSLAAQPTLAIAPGDTALVLHDAHADPDLKLEDYLLVSTVGDQLRTITTFRLASEFVCGWTGLQIAAFATRPDPGRGYRRIDVTVRSVVTHPPGDCGPGRVPKAGTRLYLASLRWNASRARYEPTNAELKRLEYDNERLFK
jgi:hypothetical protein